MLLKGVPVAGSKPKATDGFRVLVGINYGPGDTRAEPGDVVTDIPAKSITWMLAQNIIEPANGTTPPVEAPVETGGE